MSSWDALSAAGDERQEKILELLAFREAQAPEMNTHVIGCDHTHDGANSNNRAHGPVQLYLNVHGGAEGKDTLRFHENAFHADVHALGFDDLPAMFEQHAGFHRNAPGAAMLVLDSALGGADNHQQALPIERLVHEKAGACLEAPGHRRWALVIADHHDRRNAVAAGVTHLPREFGAVGEGHLI